MGIGGGTWTMEEEIRKAFWEALEESGAISTRYLISEILEEIEARERAEQEHRRELEDTFGSLTYAMRVIEGG